MLNNIFLYLIIFFLGFKTVSQQGNKYAQYLDNFAAIGRMTLTWYLLLSITMSIILYNYGFSLYGRIGVTTCFTIAVIYYYCCYKFSKLWLSKFEQGPVEKLWRKLTVPMLPQTKPTMGI